MTIAEKVAELIRRVNDADFAAELILTLVRESTREELIDEMAYGSRLEADRQAARERKRLERARKRDMTVTSTVTSDVTKRDIGVTVTECHAEKRDSVSPAPPLIRSDSESLPGILSSPGSDQTQTRVEQSVIGFNCDGPVPTFGVTETMFSEHVLAFPSLDVMLEYRQAQAWLGANPSRRKTAKGMPAFLVSWLSRAQNSGRGRDMSRGQSVTSRDRSVTPVARNFTQEANDQVRLNYLQQVAAMEGK